MKNTIRVARKARKLTHEELAKAMKVSTVTVWNWENGVTDPTISSAIELSCILKTPIYELFDMQKCLFNRKVTGERKKDIMDALHDYWVSRS